MKLPPHLHNIANVGSDGAANAVMNRDSIAVIKALSITLVVLSLAGSVASCARVPVPTSDATPTRSPSATPTRASPSITPTVLSSQTAVVTPTARAIPLPNETSLAANAGRNWAAAARGQPTPVLTPIAYDHNPRAILVEADVYGGLAPVPRGAHVPFFRLYADGFVIFAGEQAPLSTGLDAVVRTGNLDESAVQQLLAFIRDAGFYSLEAFYQPRPLPADLPTARITVNLDKAKTVRVYAPGLQDTAAAFYDVFDYITHSASDKSNTFIPSSGYLVALPAGGVSDFRSKDVLAEWVPSVGVRLADATEGTLVRGSAYTNVVALVAQTFPNTLYREGDRVYRVEFSPELPRAVHQTDWVGLILQAPREFEGRTFDVVGYYRGANLLGEASGSPPVTKSDWVIADETGAIYVTGALPSGLNPHSRADIWSLVRVRGVVVYVRLGTSHLDARKVEVLASSAPERTPVPSTTATLTASPTITIPPTPPSTRTLAPTSVRTPATPAGAPATATFSPTAAPTPLRLATKATGNR